MKPGNFKVYTATAIAALLSTSFLSGCAPETEVSAPFAKSALVADPSLFEPATDEMYALRGEIIGAKVQSNSGIPIETVETEANGYMILSDGVLSEAEIVATIDSVHHLKFELTEPAIFERQGHLSDLIHGVGKLTTDSGTYHGTRVLLAPKETATGTTVDATIDIPNFIAIAEDEESLQLALRLEKSH